ncbi:MAG TPA: PPOX class F420-dependent oxidoreductase [Candidatus Limnocylindrales bacterium]|nr:PPOX class F420-dependent oxidoreductase [Candidatus Limnocylindrales bacterium]
MKNASGISPTRAEGLRIFGVVPYSRLTTFKRDGSRVSVPIWQAVGGDRIYMFTEAASWKVKRLRNNPRIELTTCDWRGNPDGGPTWTGSGHVVGDKATVARAYEAIDRKYGWQKWLLDIVSKIGGRYNGRAVLEITLDEAADA